MSTAKENSVMFAIRELQKLETDRVEEEARRREAEEAERRAVAMERERREREAVEHAARVAEAEARMRVEADQRARDDELASRMASLRKELEAVQADRLRLAERIAPVAHAQRPSGRGWAVAFGLASVVAGGLAVMLVMRSQTVAAVMPEAAPPSTSSAIATTVETPRATTAPAAIAAPAITDVTGASEAVGPESATDGRAGARVRGRADRRTRTARATERQEDGASRTPSPRENRDDRALREITEDRCGDDPTCGL